MKSKLARIPGRTAARHYGPLRDAIAGARADLLRNGRRRVKVRGIDVQGRVVEAELRSADGPARRKVLAIVG